MVPKLKQRKRTRASLPDDPDKDPWTSTQVSNAHGAHIQTAAKKGLNVEEASRERWMAVKGLVVCPHPQEQAVLATQGV